jgi:HK97 family phage major capsid protein/HK97 family phage prohead protease
MIERATLNMQAEQRRMPVEIRMSPDGRKLTGYAALYNTDSEDMGFIEQLAPGVFDRSIADNDEVLALVEHDPQKLLGRLSSGTLRINSDKRGLGFEIDMPDTTLGRDTIEQVKRGDLSQMSFSFSLYDDNSETHSRNADGKRTRRINRARLHSIDVVAQPAYKATAVAVRSSPMSTPDRMDEVRRLTGEMRSILDGEVTSETSEQYDRMELRLQEVEQEIRNTRREDALKRAERLLDEPTRKAPTPSPLAFPGTSDITESRAYSDAFFANLNNSATHEQRDMLAGSGSGANIVPTEMEAAIVEILDDPTTMRGICSVTQARGDREIPVETAIGSGGWLAEQGTITPSDVTIVKKTATPKSYGTAISWSSLQGAQAIIGVDAYFGRAVGRTIAQGLDSGYMVGTGASNQPTGLVPALGTASFMNLAVTKGDGIIDAAHTLAPQYRAGARWMMNDTTLAVVRKLKTTDGNYLWVPSERYSEIRDGIAGTLYGFPVTVAASMANTSIVFGDISRSYRIYDWGSTSMLMDPYTNAATMSTTIWAWRQTDGVLVDASAAAVFDTDAS